MKIKNPFGTKFKTIDTTKQKRIAIITPFGIPIRAPKKLFSVPTIGNENTLFIAFANIFTKIISKINNASAIIEPISSAKTGLINLFDANFTALSVPFSRFSSKIFSNEF